MVHFTELRVFKEARKNIQDIAKICEGQKGFGDLHNQLKRAVISVVSNIAAPQGYKKRRWQWNQKTEYQVSGYSSWIES